MHSSQHSLAMPSVDREESRDRELVLKHQSSFSDSGRSSVPMYVTSTCLREIRMIVLNDTKDCFWTSQVG